MDIPMIDDDTLIPLVEQFTCLYNKKDKNYRNISAKKKAWMAIAATMNENVEHLQARWVNLRGRYGKMRRDLRDNVIKEIPETHLGLFNSMNFLDKFIRSRNVFKSSKPGGFKIQKIEKKTQEDDSQNFIDFFSASASNDSSSTSSFFQQESKTTQIESEEDIKELIIPISTEESPTRSSKRLKAAAGETIFLPNESFQTIANTTVDEEDRLFGMAVAETLSKCSSRKQKAIAKSNIFKILAELEEDSGTPQNQFGFRLIQPRPS